MSNEERELMEEKAEVVMSTETELVLSQRMERDNKKKRTLGLGLVRWLLGIGVLFELTIVKTSLSAKVGLSIGVAG